MRRQSLYKKSPLGLLECQQKKQKFYTLILLSLEIKKSCSQFAKYHNFLNFFCVPLIFLAIFSPRFGPSRRAIKKISVTCAKNALMRVKMVRYFWVIAIHDKWEIFFHGGGRRGWPEWKHLALSKLQISVAWPFFFS